MSYKLDMMLEFYKAGYYVNGYIVKIYKRSYEIH
jgi:hypothetical protein